MKTLIKNGIIVNSDGRSQADLVIEDEKILMLARSGTVKETDRVIDARGKYVVPGAIDTHTHIEEPFMGCFPEETWGDATKNAAIGGVTTVINFVNQVPGKTLVESAKEERRRIEKLSSLDFGMHGVFCSYEDMDAVLAEFPQLKRAGIPSVKTFTIYSDSGFFADDYTILKLMEGVRKIGGCLGVHAENMPIGERRQVDYVKAGKTAAKYWGEVKDSFTEAEAVARVCRLAEYAGCQLYIAHVSTKEACEIISSYRAKGLPIFGEGCSHYLTKNKKYYSGKNGHRAICSPPYRTEADNAGLWKGLQDGAISIIGSDHCPYGTVAKDAAYKEFGFPAVANGNPGILENVPVLFSEGVSKKRITVERFVQVTSANPSKMFGFFGKKGAIKPGFDADVVIIDPKATKRLGKNLYRGMDWTPYEGMVIQGVPVMTMLRGEVIVENGQYVGTQTTGKFVPGSMDKEIVKTIQ